MKGCTVFLETSFGLALSTADGSMVLNAINGSFSWTPTPAQSAMVPFGQAGVYELFIQFPDGSGGPYLYGFLEGDAILPTSSVIKLVSDHIIANNIADTAAPATISVTTNTAIVTPGHGSAAQPAQVVIQGGGDQETRTVRTIGAPAAVGVTAQSAVTSKGRGNVAQPVAVTTTGKTATSAKTSGGQAAPAAEMITGQTATGTKGQMSVAGGGPANRADHRDKNNAYLTAGFFA